MRHCGQLASFLLAAPSWQAGVPPPWAPEPRHCGAQSTSRLASGTHHRTQIRFVDASGARRDGQGTVSPSLRQINEEAAQWAAFLFWLAAIAAGTTGLNRRCRRGRSNGPPADGARSAASHLRRSSPRTQAPTNASPSSTHTTVIPHNAPNVSRTGSSRSRAGSYSTRTGCPGS